MVQYNKICKRCNKKFKYKYWTKKFCLDCLPGNSDSNKFKILIGKEIKCDTCGIVYTYKKELACTKTKCHNCVIRKRRLRYRNKAIDLLGGKCNRCGYDKCRDSFVFHHVDPSTKDYDVLTNPSWGKIQRELVKCVMICANCHYEVHAILRNGGIVNFGV